MFLFRALSLTLVVLSVFAEDVQRQFVHTLDYLSKDYPIAMAENSDFEYQEQVEFSTSLINLSEKLNLNKKIKSDISKLKQLITVKSSPDQVVKLTREIQKEFLQIANLELFPSSWASIEKGKILFQKNCVSCHGEKGLGDGVLSKDLNPKPTNFHDPKLMSGISAFSAFNTIRMGVDGTSMSGFSNFSDTETWDLAFYVMSLRHKGNNKITESAEVLKKVSLGTDEDLEKEFGLQKLADYRTHIPENKTDQFISLAIKNLDSSKDFYSKGQVSEARNKAVSAYLEGIEPVEPRIKASNPALLLEVEKKMFEVRSAIEQNKTKDEVFAIIESTKNKIVEVANEVIEKPLSGWVAATGAGGIILREGFEAVLVIIALLATLRATGMQSAVIWLHGGWILALALGIASWFFSGFIISLGGANRELLEAITSLIAVVMLLFIGFWMHRQSEISKWKKVIEKKIKSAIGTGQLYLISGISFVAVFREAFETVLFIRAISIQTEASSRISILYGVIISLIIITIFTLALIKYSVKLPLKRLFSICAFIMGVLAIILVGKGIHALQETGNLSITSTPLSINFDLLGLYPTLETLVAQLSILIIVSVIYRFGKPPVAKAV